MGRIFRTNKLIRQILRKIDDHTDFGPLIDESNVLVEAFDSAEENIVENEIESESEDDDY